MTLALAILLSLAAGLCFGWAACRRVAPIRVNDGIARVNASQDEMQHYLKTAAAQRTALLVAARDLLASVEPGLPRCRVGQADAFVASVAALREAVGMQTEHAKELRS